MHPPDFVDAHHRHWEDADLLCGHDRWANAAYILGLSAECGLKAVMHALEWMPLDAKGTPQQRRHQRHIQSIWPLFEDLASKRLGARYRLDPESPFGDWSHHNRYASRSHVRPMVVSRYQKATKEVARIMRLAAADGVL